MTCATSDCGVSFGITEGYDSRLRKSHNTFYCPNAHSNVYKQKTEEEKLRERLGEKELDILRLSNEIKNLKRPAPKKRATKKAKV